MKIGNDKMGETNVEKYKEFCDSIRQLYHSGFDIMLFHQGFGETAIFLKVVYKYVEAVGKPLFVITHCFSRTELLKMSSDVYEVIEINEMLFYCLSNDKELKSECEIKDFFALHTYDLDRSSMKYEVCDFLGIPKSTPYRNISLPAVDANWEEYFNAKGLQINNTVYIVPHALFLGKVVSDDFWERLVRSLKEMGYGVLINLPTETIQGVPFAYFDMAVSLKLVELCGMVIGARTGFLDLVAAFTDAEIQAIYPDDSSPAWEVCKKYTWTEPVYGDYAKKYMESTGLMTLFPREHIKEWIYTNDDDTLKCILGDLKR